MNDYYYRFGRTPEERLQNRSMRLDNGCLVWTGGKERFGYGKTVFKGVKYTVHRLSWELANKRSVPAGLCVCHHCDNPSCFEPSHLFLGTPADNNSDMIRKGRHVGSPGERNGRAQLTAEQVAAIITDTRRQIYIAADYGIKQPQVSRIKLGQTWARDTANPDRGGG